MSSKVTQFYHIKLTASMQLIFSITMTRFSDIVNSVYLPSCCMRKNNTLSQYLKDDLTILGISFGLYLMCYMMGFHALCLMSMASMNIITFQAGMSFYRLQREDLHVNQFDELDISTSSESSVEELSIKQKEQGATIANPMSLEQEEKLNEQIQKVVEETKLRNRKRTALTTCRTPSCSTLTDEGISSDDNDVPPLVPLEYYSDDNDMPPLVPLDNLCNTQYCCSCSSGALGGVPLEYVNSDDSDIPSSIPLEYVYSDDSNMPLEYVNTNSSDIPNYSQSHYLHGSMDIVD